MHEVCIVGPAHVLSIDSPASHGVIVVQNLAVFLGAGNTGTAPVLGIDKVSTLECLLLVVFHTGIATNLGSSS